MEKTGKNLFLGRGWSFPPTFHKGLGSVEMVEGETDVRKCLQVLLTTSLGERVLQPDYGCNVSQMQFDTTGPDLQSEMAEMFRSAISRFEPRVKLENVSLFPSGLEGIIEIHVDYKILQTNTLENLVFPFYLNSGITAT